MSLSKRAAARPIEETHSVAQKKMLNLAHDCAILHPHVLTKIDRVVWIAAQEDLERVDKNTPASRKLMAVPFVGKDVPSHASEFAQPDVLLGLTVLAYRYEGLRVSDVIEVVKLLQDKLREEVGPYLSAPRPANSLSGSAWAASACARSGCAASKSCFSSGRKAKTRSSPRSTSNGRCRSKSATAGRWSAPSNPLLIDEKDAPVYNVNPLHIFQLSDRFQAGQFVQACVGAARTRPLLP